MDVFVIPKYEEVLEALEVLESASSPSPLSITTTHPSLSPIFDNTIIPTATASEIKPSFHPSSTKRQQRQPCCNNNHSFSNSIQPTIAIDYNFSLFNDTTIGKDLTYNFVMGLDNNNNYHTKKQDEKSIITQTTNTKMIYTNTPLEYDNTILTTITSSTATTIDSSLIESLSILKALLVVALLVALFFIVILMIAYRKRRRRETNTNVSPHYYTTSESEEYDTTTTSNNDLTFYANKNPLKEMNGNLTIHTIILPNSPTTSPTTAQKQKTKSPISEIKIPSMQSTESANTAAATIPKYSSHSSATPRHQSNISLLDSSDDVDKNNNIINSV